MTPDELLRRSNAVIEALEGLHYLDAMMCLGVAVVSLWQRHGRPQDAPLMAAWIIKVTHDCLTPTEDTDNEHGPATRH